MMCGFVNGYIFVIVLFGWGWFIVCEVVKLWFNCCLIFIFKFLILIIINFWFYMFIFFFFVNVVVIMFYEFVVIVSFGYV